MFNLSTLIIYSASAYSELHSSCVVSSTKAFIHYPKKRKKKESKLWYIIYNQIEDVLEAVKYDKDVRVVILRSLAPGVFSAGKSKILKHLQLKY